MLAWLRRLFTRRNDREIFAYWDGEKDRRIDPLVAWRGLWSDQEIDLGGDYKVALNPIKKDGTPFYPDSMVNEAEQRILTLTRRVFDVKPWSEATEGLTVNETMELLARYITYRTDLKKKHKTSPIPSPPTDTTGEPPSLDSTPDECQPTIEPAYGSTESESSDDELSGLSKPSAVL